MSDALWAYALEVYGRPGVSAACLELQDSHDQNVPLLLWAAWLSASRRGVDDETLEAASDAARAWERAVISPLRTVRRTLAKPIPDLADAGRLAVREQLKAVELLAERRLLDDLAEISADGARPASLSLDASLARTARAWAPAVPRAALNRLAALLT